MSPRTVARFTLTTILGASINVDVMRRDFWLQPSPLFDLLLQQLSTAAAEAE